MSQTDKMQTKEHVVAKIKELAKEEKFKVDAFFFFCFPGGTPNEKLKNACEKYLQTAESKTPDAEVTRILIAELEAAAAAAPREEDKHSLMNNKADIKHILQHKALL